MLQAVFWRWRYWLHSHQDPDGWYWFLYPLLHIWWCHKWHITISLQSYRRGPCVQVKEFILIINKLETGLLIMNFFHNFFLSFFLCCHKECKTNVFWRGHISRSVSTNVLSPKLLNWFWFLYFLLGIYMKNCWMSLIILCTPNITLIYIMFSLLPPKMAHSVKMICKRKYMTLIKWFLCYLMTFFSSAYIA
jgi:hypothetical protein